VKSSIPIKTSIAYLICGTQGEKNQPRLEGKRGTCRKGEEDEKRRN
jgi:hypothetical protein